VSRPDDDPVARYIATIVQHHLITSPAERPDLPEQPAEITWMEAHPIGLDTGVVVTTAEGNRYFLVRVAEFTTR
jgi:hypothetical protein